MIKNIQPKSRANCLLAAGMGFLLCGAGAQTNAQPPPIPTVDKAATATPTAPPHIEEQAMALLKRNQQAMFALKTYAVECRTTRTRAHVRPGFAHIEYEVATLAAQKPNKLRYEQWYLKQDDKPVPDWTKPAQLPDTLFACDGVTRYQQFGDQHRVSKLVTSRYLGTLLEPWTGFFATEDAPLGKVERARKEQGLREVRWNGREDVGGVMCDKVHVEYDTSYAGKAIHYKTTWYFGPDSLTRRCIDSFDVDNGGFTNDVTLVNLRTNAPVDAARFAYTPRPGSKLIDDNPPISLLANGTTAPDITGQDSRSKPVKLADLRGKIVVVDFWASWCGPCNQAMPHNQAIIKKLQAEGLPVVMLAVDNADTRAAFDGWIKSQGKAFPALQFVFVPAGDTVSGQYKASTIPTQYVLDKNGVIRAGFVGYGGPTDDLEKAARAALAADMPKAPDKTTAAANKP